MDQPHPESGDSEGVTASPLPRAPLVAGVVALVSAVVAAGVWLEWSEAQRLRREADLDLETVATLKVEEITAWRAERLGYGSLLTESPSLPGDTARFFAAPSPATRAPLLTRFQSLRRLGPYDDVLLVNPGGHILLSLSGHAAGEETHGSARRSLRTAFQGHRAVLTDLHAGPNGLPPHLEVVAPVFAGPGDTAEALGAVLLRCNAESALFPLISTWPTPSSSAETLLVRREGNDVVFLNELRHRKSTALRLRFPLSQLDLPAAQVVGGQRGVTRGKDYRGVDVLAVVSPIPDSPWFIVAKVDAAEALGPARDRALLIGGLLAGFVAATIAGFLAFWQRTSKGHYKELYEVERARIESERRFRSLYENTTIGLYRSTPDGRIVMANPALVRMLGFDSAAELLERNLEQEGFAPGHARADFRRLIEDAGGVEGFESGWARRDGSVVFVRESATVVRDQSGRPLYYDGTAEDVTGHRRAEAERDALAQQHRLALAAARLGWWHYNPLTRISDYDERYCEIFGVSGSQRPNDEILTFLHPDDLPRVWAAVEAALDPVDPKPYVTTYRVNRPDGTVRWVEAHGLATFEGEGEARCAVGFVGTVEDVTDRKLAEDERLRLSEELELRVSDRTTELSAANEELSAFAYSVSHDLRAPLRGIDGWSLALLDDCADRLDDQGRQYLGRVRSEAQRMGRLIDDLLALSRVTRTEMRAEPVDLSSLAEAITDRLRTAHVDRQVELTVQPNLSARGDATLLELALTNLLDNAWKFSSTRSTARIEFGRTPVDGQQAFYVRDNGAGFDMAYSDKLFGAFQRLHRSSEFPGTGVGLATVQRIIRRHGGRIWAEAGVDEGATFYFTLEEDA